MALKAFFASTSRITSVSCNNNNKYNNNDNNNNILIIKIIITMHKRLHQKSNIDRLYIPRKEGGRGLLNVEDTVHLAILGLLKYIGISGLRFPKGTIAHNVDCVIKPRKTRLKKRPFDHSFLTFGVYRNKKKQNMFNLLNRYLEVITDSYMQ